MPCQRWGSVPLNRREPVAAGQADVEPPSGTAHLGKLQGLFRGRSDAHFVTLAVRHLFAESPSQCGVRRRQSPRGSCQFSHRVFCCRAFSAPMLIAIFLLNCHRACFGESHFFFFRPICFERTCGRATCGLSRPASILANHRLLLCSSAAALAMAKPKPMPSDFEVTEGVQTWADRSDSGRTAPCVGDVDLHVCL